MPDPQLASLLRLLGRPQGVQRRLQVLALEPPARDGAEHCLALVVELRDRDRGLEPVVAALDVAQPLSRWAFAVSRHDRRLVVLVGLDGVELERAPVGVVAREHLLVHVEEELALAVLEHALAARARDAAARVDEVPVSVVLVGEQVLAQVVERRLLLLLDGGDGRGRTPLLLGEGLDGRNREPRALRVVDDEELKRMLHDAGGLLVGEPLGLVERGLDPRLALRLVCRRHQALGHVERAVELLGDEGRERCLRLLGDREGGRRAGGRRPQQAVGSGLQVVDVGHAGLLLFLRGQGIQQVDAQ
jgi:hypothetical protein